ncbi:hypothetical protein Tco_0473977 [Tanacetum coccineum]
MLPVQVNAVEGEFINTSTSKFTKTHNLVAFLEKPKESTGFEEIMDFLNAIKDKGKGIMVEPKVPLKKKDQVAFDEEMARNLEAQLQAELIEEERLARQKEKEANIALIESDNTQAMMEADF